MREPNNNLIFHYGWRKQNVHAVPANAAAVDLAEIRRPKLSV